MFEKFKRLGKEAVIYGVGGAATKFIGFLLLPIYTRAFNPADYGVMDIISTLTALAGIILTSGTETALSYYFFRLPDPTERRKTVTSVGLYLFGVNIFVALCVISFAEPISTLVFETAEYAVYLRWAILALPFSGLLTLNLNLLRLRHKPWAYISLTVPYFLLTAFLNIYLIVIKQVGIIGVYWTNLATGVLFTLAGLWLNRKLFGLTYIGQRLLQIIRYGLPLVVGGLSVWVTTYLDRYFLLRFSGIDDVGLYAVGVKLASVIVFITSSFRIANAPFQFEMASDRDATHFYSRTLVYFNLITSIVCVGISLFSRPILMVMTTPEYLNSYQVVPFMLYAAVFDGVTQIVAVGLLLAKRTGYTGIAIAIGGGLHIGFLVLLVPSLGLVGASLAALLTRTMTCVLLYWGAQRVYPIPYELGRVFRVLVGAGAVITMGMLNRSGNIWLESLTALGLMIVFLIMIPLFSFLETKERQLLLHSVKQAAARLTGERV